MRRNEEGYYVKDNNLCSVHPIHLDSLLFPTFMYFPHKNLQYLFIQDILYF